MGKSIMSRHHCLICASDEGLFLDILAETNIRNKLETCLAIKVSKENTPTTKVCHKCTFEIYQCNKFIDKYKQAHKTGAAVKVNYCSLCHESDKRGHIFDLTKHKYGVNDLWQKIRDLFQDHKEKDKKKHLVCLSCRYCIDVLTDLKNVFEESSKKLRNITENGINPVDLPKTKTAIVNRNTTRIESPNFELHTPSDTDSESSMTRARGRSSNKQTSTSPAKPNLRFCGSCRTTVENGVDMYRHHRTGLTVCKNCWVTADPDTIVSNKLKRAGSEEVKQCTVFLKDVLNPHDRPYRIEKDNQGNPVFIVTDESSENESKPKNKSKNSPKLRTVAKALVTEMNDQHLVDVNSSGRDVNSRVKLRPQRGSTNKRRKSSEQSIQEEIDVVTSESDNKSKHKPKIQKGTSLSKKDKDSEQSTHEDIDVVSSDESSKLKNTTKQVIFEKKKDESGHTTPVEVDVLSSESESSKQKSKTQKSTVSDRKAKNSDHSAQEEIDVEEEKPRTRTRGRPCVSTRKKKDSDLSAQEEIDVENSEGETKPKFKTRINQEASPVKKDKESDTGQVNVDIDSSDDNKSKDEVKGKGKPKGKERNVSDESIQEDEKIEIKSKDNVNVDLSKELVKQDKKRKDSESQSGQEDIIVDNSDADGKYEEEDEKVEKFTTPDKKMKSNANNRAQVSRSHKLRKDSEQSIHDVIDLDTSDGDGKVENEKKGDDKSKSKTKSKKVDEASVEDNNSKDMETEFQKTGTKDSPMGKSKSGKSIKLDKAAKEEHMAHDEVNIEDVNEEDKPQSRTRKAASSKKVEENKEKRMSKSKQKISKEEVPKVITQEDIDIEEVETDKRTIKDEKHLEQSVKNIETINESKTIKSKKRKDSERSNHEDVDIVVTRRTRRGAFIVANKKTEPEAELREENDSSAQKAKRKKIDNKSDNESDSNSVARGRRSNVKSDAESDTGSVRKGRSQIKKNDSTPQSSMILKRKVSESEILQTPKRRRSSSAESASSIRKSSRKAKHTKEELHNIDEVDESIKEVTHSPITNVKKRGKTGTLKANDVESDSNESEQTIRSRRSSSISSRTQSPLTLPFKSPPKKNSKALLLNKNKKIESSEERDVDSAKIKEPEASSNEFVCKICGNSFVSKYSSLQHELTHFKSLKVTLERVQVSKMTNCTLEHESQLSVETLNKTVINEVNPEIDVDVNPSLNKENNIVQKSQDKENMEVCEQDIPTDMQNENKEIEVTVETEEKSNKIMKTVLVQSEEETLGKNIDHSDNTMKEVENNTQNNDKIHNAKEDQRQKSKRQSLGSVKRVTRRSKIAEVDEDIKTCDKTLDAAKSDIHHEDANPDLQNDKNLTNIPKENESLEVTETSVVEEKVPDSTEQPATVYERHNEVDDEQVKDDTEEIETVTNIQVVDEEIRNETVADEPLEDEPIEDEPVQDKPVEDEPLEYENPVGELIVKEPEVDEPVVGESVAGESVVGESVIDESVIDESVIDESVVDKHTVDETAMDEPIVHTSGVDGPTIDEPEVNEPIVDDPEVNEPIVDDLEANEPVVDEPMVDQSVVDEIIDNETIVHEGVIDEMEVDETGMDEQIVSAETVVNEPMEDITTIDAFDLPIVESDELMETPLPDDDLEHEELAHSEISDAFCENEATKDDGIEEISSNELSDEEICENDKHEEVSSDIIEKDVNDENIVDDDVTHFIIEDDEAMAQESLEELLESRGLQVVDEIAESVTDEESEREKEVDVSSERNSFQGNPEVESEIEIKISEAEYSEILDVTPAPIHGRLDLEIIDGVDIQESRMEEVETEELEECGEQEMLVVKTDAFIDMTNDQPELVDIEEESRVCDEIDDSDSAIVVREVLNEVFNLATTNVQTRLDNNVEPISDVEDDDSDEKKLLPETLENISRELRSSADMPSLDGLEDDEIEELPA